MTSSRPRPSLVVLGAWTVVLLGIASVTYGLGVEDQHYQLSGIREDPLYLRGPGFRVIGGVIASALFIAVTLVMRGAGIRWQWWWLLIAGWGGYAAGSAVAIAAGGPVDHPATMRLDFGAPLRASVEVPATCRTPPANPGTVVFVSADGLAFRVQFRDVVTGKALRYPAPDGVSVGFYGDGSPRRTLVIPGLPTRPPSDRIPAPGATAAGLPSASLPPPSSFLDGYFYRANTATISDREGIVRVAATRATTPVGSQLVPNDPWPQAYELTVSWTCDLASTKAVQVATPTP